MKANFFTDSLDLANQRLKPDKIARSGEGFLILKMARNSP